MADIFNFEEHLRPLFEVHGRPKKNNVKDFKTLGKDGQHKQRALRVAKGAPEVMVKVTGHARGAKHLRRLMQYITRDGELAAESESNESIEGREAVAQLAHDWNTTSGERRLNTRDTVNIVLSMPADTDDQAVLRAAREFAAWEFSANHDYVMVLHTQGTDPSPNPSPNPHVHLVVKSLGYDGRRVNPRKADLQRWREVFAERLIENGVEAEATPRVVRGVVKRPKPRSIHHASKRDPRTQQFERAVREIAAEITGKILALERPWEAAIRDRQKVVRETWLEAATFLEAGANDDRAMAATIRVFVEQMPAIETQGQEIAAQLRAQLYQGQDREHDNGELDR